MPADRVRAGTVAERDRLTTGSRGPAAGGIAPDVGPKLRADHKILGMVLRGMDSVGGVSNDRPGRVRAVRRGDPPGGTHRAREPHGQGISLPELVPDAAGA